MEGTGTIDDPFRITNVTELQAMNNNLSAYYVKAIEWQIQSEY